MSKAQKFDPKAIFNHFIASFPTTRKKKTKKLAQNKVLGQYVENKGAAKVKNKTITLV